MHTRHKAFVWVFETAVMTRRLGRDDLAAADTRVTRLSLASGFIDAPIRLEGCSSSLGLW